MSYRIIESAPKAVLETAKSIDIRNQEDRINEIVSTIFYPWRKKVKNI